MNGSRTAQSCDRLGGGVDHHGDVPAVPLEDLRRARPGRGCRRRGGCTPSPSSLGQPPHVPRGGRLRAEELLAHVVVDADDVQARGRRSAGPPQTRSARQTRSPGRQPRRTPGPGTISREHTPDQESPDYHADPDLRLARTNQTGRRATTTRRRGAGGATLRGASPEPRPRSQHDEASGPRIVSRLRPPLVGKGGVEPPRPFGHTDLNRARLPFRHFPGRSRCASPSRGPRRTGRDRLRWRMSPSRAISARGATED